MECLQVSGYEMSQPMKSDRKTRTLLSTILDQMHPFTFGSVLVVGCGSGREAGEIAEAYNADVTGIDLGRQFTLDSAAAGKARLLVMNAETMNFSDHSFDLVYSFHALEHIERPVLALREMWRVLRPGGGFVIGVPNRDRLLGYFSGNATALQKLTWNAVDWRMRLTGKWSNAAGAHAGFTRVELLDLLEDNIGPAFDISAAYYRNLYSRHAKKISVLEKSGLSKRIFPCIYACGKKSGNSSC